MLGKILLKVALLWCILALVKAREEETVEQCEQVMPQSLKGRICEIRQYTPVKGQDMDNHMQCVLQVIGFVEESGDVVFQELLGLLKMTDSKQDHVGNIKTCKAEADQVASSSKANKFYTCFLKTSSSQAFKMAFDYVELLLAGKIRSDMPFDASRVSMLMRQIDDGLCA
ncbi:37 kDa salivary gland allergen Aed a 2-like [Anopheles funestus]|uniref:37 kDa salivary gland allergen Aed a 2-like n=1 Tax=Anopheles funestus TaxID=62324 RepID=UPI0020C69932|nr:37 kDa salivary gland allergen Aed a 2-like [Anopheles funestus]